MRSNTLVACLVILSPAVSEGATLLTNEVFLTIADGSGGVPTLAENITEPSLAWYREDLRFRQYELNFGYRGLGGGRVTLQTEPGETVESVEIHLGIGATGYAPWNFAFQGFGSSPDIQVWVSQNPLTGSGLGFVSLAFQPDNRAPIYFDVQTSAGTFGAQYYAASPVPEPTSALMAILSAAAILVQRRRLYQRFDASGS